MGSRSSQSILASCLARDCAWHARVPARNRVTDRSRRLDLSLLTGRSRGPGASSRAAFSRRHCGGFRRRTCPSRPPAPAPRCRPPQNQWSWATSLIAASMLVRLRLQPFQETMSKWLVDKSSSSSSGSPAQRATQRGAGQLRRRRTRAQRTVEVGVIAEPESMPWPEPVRASCSRPCNRAWAPDQRFRVASSWAPGGHSLLQARPARLSIAPARPRPSSYVVPQRYSPCRAEDALVVPGRPARPWHQHKLAARRSFTSPASRRRSSVVLPGPRCPKGVYPVPALRSLNETPHQQPLPAMSPFRSEAMTTAMTALSRTRVDTQ